MAMTCPQCSYSNPDQSAFCVRCGNKLFSTGQTGQFAANVSNASPFSSPSSAGFPPTVSSAGLPPIYAAMPMVPSPVAGMQPVAQAAPMMAPTSTYPAQMGTGQGLASIRRAFAGHGRLIMHYSWLLEGQHNQAVPVRTAVTTMFQQRNASGLRTGAERLMERGLLMEERDYVKIQRGVSTVFVYVAPAGQDLYISRATTVLPTISYWRAALFGLALFLLLLAFTAPSSLQSLASNSGSSAYGGGSSFSTLIGTYIITFLLSLLAAPLLIFLIGAGARSFYSWLIEKDFWILLRPGYLNAFQLDDIALLEHTSDSIVHDAVKQLGLDASKIIAPPQGYQPKRKIRGI